MKKTIGEAAVSRVAALMPAYNPGEIINRAVESLTKSTYPCDIYIVDDGSDVPITQILAAFPRTKVIRLDRNSGVTHALNVGLKTILMQPYEFVARLDADDFCYPERIERQIEFLDRHPGIAAVGAWARFTEETTGRILYIARTPDQPELVKKALQFNNAVMHPSLMIRTSVLKLVGLYSEQYPTSQDYELFRRIARQHSIANIPTVLVDQRLSLRGVQLMRRRRQLFDRLRIQLKYFQAFEIGAWIGLFKTLLLFLFPVSFVEKIKAYKDSMRSRPAIRVRCLNALGRRVSGRERL